MWKRTLDPKKYEVRELGDTWAVGGGSRVDVEIDHTSARGLRGTAVLLMQRLVGPVMFPRLWRSALDRLPADEERAG